jgi:DNA repair exonuclease SbcCD ATPase subunit
VGYAWTLIDAYIRKDMPDSTTQYLQHLASRKDFENDYLYCNAEVLTSQGKYEEGCKWWKQAYNRNEAEWQFMINQRLGAINAEYDLLNAELENKKEKLRIRGAYNVVLLIVIVILMATYTIKERHRKNAEKLKLDVEELEQDVCELEENVSNLELNVSHLEGNVNNLEQEVSNLERDIQKRKERFSNLFEEYRKVYKAHRDTIFADALSNLSEMHKAYPELKKTDLAMIWLTFMDCSRDSICELINISQTYYYQRKSIIHRVLEIPVRDGESWQKPLEKMVSKYIQIEN